MTSHMVYDVRQLKVTSCVILYQPFISFISGSYASLVVHTLVHAVNVESLPLLPDNSSLGRGDGALFESCTSE